MKCIHIRSYIGFSECRFTEEHGKLLHYWLLSRGSIDEGRVVVSKHNNNYALGVF